MADNKDCPKCEGTGTVGPDLGHQVPCDATGEDDDGGWYCIDGTATYFDCLDQHDANPEWSVTTINAVADLASTAKKIERLEAQLAALKEERDRLIAEALAEGATVRKVATISGVSKSRVDQIHRGVPR